MQRAEEFGLSVEKSPTNGGHRSTLARHIQAAQRWRRLSDEKEQGVGDRGEAFLDGARQGDGERPSQERSAEGCARSGAYQGKHIIIATGARPRVLAWHRAGENLVLDLFRAMAPARMPKSLLIIGSGAIGIAFASFYRTLGAEVTVVEVLAANLPSRTRRSPGWRQEPSRNKASRF